MSLCLNEMNEFVQILCQSIEFKKFFLIFHFVVAAARISHRKRDDGPLQDNHLAVTENLEGDGRASGRRNT